MRAIDTNVLVRYLVADEARQATAARRAIDGGPVWVSRTVLLETEWVLRAAYDLPSGEICAALRAFAGLPTANVESPDIVARALDWMEAGMDFADGLHLAARPDSADFVTFDKRLIQTARSLKLAGVTAP